MGKRRKKSLSKRGRKGKATFTFSVILIVATAPGPEHTFIRHIPHLGAADIQTAIKLESSQDSLKRPQTSANAVNFSV